MAATIPVETESGTYSGRVHPHNGYYAGDFASSRTAGFGSPSPCGPQRSE
jgi:hypothetical protein